MDLVQRICFRSSFKIPIISTDISSQKEVMGILMAAQAEFNAIIIERNMMTALVRDIPPAADTVFLNFGGEC